MGEHSSLRQSLDLSSRRIVVGKLVRKKKRRDRWILAVRPSPQVDHVTKEITQPVSVDVGILRGQHTALPYDFLFLSCVIRVECRVEGSDLIATSCELIRCSPDPIAVGDCLLGVADGRHNWHVIPALGDQEQDPMENLQNILSLPNPSRKRRLAIARLVRGLENGPGTAVDRPPRVRPPYIRPKEWLLLEELERIREGSLNHRWSWMEPKNLGESRAPMESNEAPNDSEQVNGNLNIPADSENHMSHGKNRTRGEYMHNKKMPQVRGMVGRIKRLFQDRDPLHIVDVGGGRGDLGTALALAFPETYVSVVDKNESSLQAGREYAAQLNCEDRMNFVFRDMGEVVNESLQSSYPFGDSYGNQLSHGNTPLPQIDLVTGLHACGDLSDAVLAYANRLGVPFVLCPCCYTKRYIDSITPIWNSYCPVISEETIKKEEDTPVDYYQKGLSRLAEIDDHPDVSRLARVAINSMRLHGMKHQGGYDVSLEEYESLSSKRNLVLVGSRDATK